MPNKKEKTTVSSRNVTIENILIILLVLIVIILLVLFIRSKIAIAKKVEVENSKSKNEYVQAYKEQVKKNYIEEQNAQKQQREENEKLEEKLNNKMMETVYGATLPNEKVEITSIRFSIRLEDINILSIDVRNTTNQMLQNEKIQIQFLDENKNVIGSVEGMIETLDPNKDTFLDLELPNVDIYKIDSIRFV